MFYRNYSWQGLLFCIIIYVIMLIIAKPHITFFNPQKNNIRKGIKFFFFLLIINSVFAFWEYDTYHYWEAFTIAGFYKQYIVTEYEQFYNWLAGFVHNDYFLWRTCIFVPACLFMYYTAKRLNLLNRNLLVAIVLFGAFLSYTRGMLGHTMLVFGLVLFLTSKKSTKFIAFLIICASYFLHNSMYINLIFALLAIIPFRKKSIILSFIAFPFLTILATYFVDNIVSGQLNITLADGVGGVSDKTLVYASSEKMKLNTLGKIGKVIGMIPQYIALFYLCRRYMQNRIGGGGKTFMLICLDLHTLQFILPHYSCLLKHLRGYMKDLSICVSSLWFLFWQKRGVMKHILING